MGTVTKLRNADTKFAQTPRQAPRPGNLPRTVDPAMLLAPVVFGAAIFSMGFAAGVIWASWWR